MTTQEAAKIFSFFAVENVVSMSNSLLSGKAAWKYTSQGIWRMHSAGGSIFKEIYDFYPPSSPEKTTRFCLINLISSMCLS